MLSDTIDVSVGPYTIVYMAKSDGQVDISSSFGGGDSGNWKENLYRLGYPWPSH